MDLSSILRTMVLNAEKKETTVQYHLFGIMYAREISDSNFSIKEIVENAGLSESYHVEVSKGVKLSQFVVLK